MREIFGTLKDGRTVEKLTISAGELTVSVLTLGAILQDARLRGVAHSLTVGSTRIADYEGAMHYHGCVAGPVANRIANATAEIDGKTFRLVPNEGATCLHGGPDATHNRLWDVTALAPDAVTLRLAMKDGEGGFPGNRVFTATFRIEAPARLTLTLRSETDAPTLVNLTNHSYWHLGGPSVREQTLTCPAERFVALAEGLIPTGATPSVAGTPYDFRAGGPVGAGRYDFCFCLSDARGPLREVARLASGGLRLTVETTEAGLQVYDGVATGALAIEAQNWSGAANQPSFPSDIVRPGKALEQLTRWSFARTG